MGEHAEFADLFLNGKTPLEIAEANFHQNLYLRASFATLIFGAVLQLAMMLTFGQRDGVTIMTVMTTKKSITVISVLTMIVGLVGFLGTVMVSTELSLYRFMIAEAEKKHIENAEAEFPLIDPDEMEASRS